jgi:gamma-glutamylcyclotransferase (GGCT)/AIG2-like uncharacterized protein YtfP
MRQQARSYKEHNIGLEGNKLISQVAVYGTLKSTGSRKGILTALLGDSVLPPAYKMYKFSSETGDFPFVIETNEVSMPVSVEIYNIANPLLEKLDAIEGHPDLFKRKVLHIKGFGDCWVYVGEYYKMIMNGELLPLGVWHESQ